MFVFLFLISPDSLVHTCSFFSLRLSFFCFIMGMDGLLMTRKRRRKAERRKKEEGEEGKKKKGGKMAESEFKLAKRKLSEFFVVVRCTYHLA